MSNESKPQEWFYLQNETWNGPFKTSGLKDLVKKGAVGPNTLLRLGVAGAPIKAHQIKSLFPNYQGEEQAAASSIKNEGILSILNDAPTMIGGALIVVILLGILIFGLTKSDKKITADSGQNGFKGASENLSKSSPQMPSKNVFQVSQAEGIASIEKEMVLIPSGKFKMGDRGDRLQVTITKPFYMAKYEVTQDQWESVMGNNPSWNKGAKLPVTDVSWNNCQEFIKKLNASTKGGYRLPTESEWEYTCRAGTTTAYSYGDNLTNIDANIDGDSIKASGTYKPNAFGMYDMHGNVWEWCNDWYDSLQDGEVSDPKGPAAGETCVLRGGSFFNNDSIARSSNRIAGTPSFLNNLFGFRLARTVVPEIEAKSNEAKKELSKNLMDLVKLKQEEDVKILAIEKELVLIPAGKFKMGSTANEKDRDSDETQHEVVLTQPYYLGKYEVTQEQWKAVMSNNPSSKTQGVKLPVTDVSWEDCQDFIKKLNAKTNGGYRLPTEAEWEYACRAGTTAAFSFGGSLTKSEANIEGDSIKAVGSYKPNAFGLYDMHGNVFEWCEDWKADYPAGAVTDPKGPATGDRRVSRGGSFNIFDPTARSSLRHDFPPTFRTFSHGFRLARISDTRTTVAPTLPKPDPVVIMPAPGKLLVAPFTEAKAKEIQKEVAKSLQKEVEEKEDLGKGVKLDLVLIPAGKFMMGSPVSEKGRYDNETQHEVTLTKPFYMGKYEITQEQYESVMGNNPSNKTKGAKLPVTNVSWDDCQEFIKKLNAKTSGGYRLPTDAEWEYACRSGTSTAYSCGDRLTESDANINGSSIKAVGSYKPNAFGIYDMHGNVNELCEDWYGDYPVGTLTDPNGPATGERRVLRGGSFSGLASGARSSDRNYPLPTTRGLTYGFRLARTP